MTFDLRLIVIALASFTVASLAASAALLVLGRRLPATAAERASALLRLRLWPATLAAAALVLAVASFIEFEPRQPEAAGMTLRLLAIAALLPLSAAAWRLARLGLDTRRARRAWLASAERVELPGVDIPAYTVASSFPIVAVVGVIKPVLVVARSVIANCTPDEMRAILAHERGHMVRRDNLRRAALQAAPDFLARTAVARRIAAAWADATEEAADDVAGRLGSDGRLRLAEALIHVARLVPAGARPVDVPASALFRGESLELRVRRLLAPEPVIEAPRAAAWRRIATRVVLLAASVLALQAIHDAVELAVTFLP